jgi:hypothetical protein
LLYTNDTMDVVQDFLRTATRQDLLFLGLAAQALFAVPFLICSFVVAGTANVGFNVVLTAFLNLALIGGSYHVIKTSKTPIAIGFLLGSSAMMAVLNLMTGVFWGQLSGCKVSHADLAGYTCTNTTAYGAVSAFAVLLFLAQVAFTAALFMWRADFISEPGGYDELPRASGYSAPSQSADL